jgi:cobalt-zinc-cadmium efflux system membrane fusion protein
MATFIGVTAYSIGVSLAIVGLAGLTGCGQPAQKPAAATPAVHAVSAEQSHEGWWCGEHGVPEEVCAMCNSKLIPDFKAKGDWCKQHDRPDSECFVCHPELEAEFAAQYEAKYGKKPPKREG